MAQGTGVRPRVVIVGAGFAGLAAVRRLKDASVDVLLVDRNNFHTFQPLLYQVATAGLEPEAIARPLRMILRGSGVRFLMAEVLRVDLERRCLLTDGGDIPYDCLVLAAGSTSNYFGAAELAEATLPLKELNDAVALRSHLLSKFEEAAREKDPETRRTLMSTVIVGGGPTGVELAGALAELKKHVLLRDYPELDIAGEARVILLEAADALLPGFPSGLQKKAVTELEKLGVEVRLNSAVERVDDGAVHLRSAESIPGGTVAWVAGVRAVSLAETLGRPPARNARIPVGRTLQLEGYPEVYVAGDIAYTEDERGAPFPMVAPVAIQQGDLAARNILRTQEGEPPLSFRYRDKGMMATIGRRSAVALVRPVQLSGVLAWFAWLSVHLFWLIGFRNKLLVLVNWAWNYLFYEQGVRLITRPTKQAERDRTA